MCIAKKKLSVIMLQSYSALYNQLTKVPYSSGVLTHRVICHPSTTGVSLHNLGKKKKKNNNKTQCTERCVYVCVRKVFSNKVFPSLKRSQIYFEIRSVRSLLHGETPSGLPDFALSQDTKASPVFHILHLYVGRWPVNESMRMLNLVPIAVRPRQSRFPKITEEDILLDLRR